MTLTNRLTLFSLVALGVVLAAFSGTTYVLARTHLMRQLNDRATATLDTPVAADEVEGDGLEWERRSRSDGHTCTSAPHRGELDGNVEQVVLEVAAVVRGLRHEMA